MANIIYATVNGKKQGLISSGCSTFSSIGNKYQNGHEDQIMVLAFEHGIAREENVSHGPISFVKPIDKSSPLFGMAISNNEHLDIDFSFYRTASSGGVELFYSIKITDANLIRINVIYPHAINHFDNQPEEIITFRYKSISWSHLIAGTSGYSIWTDIGS
ncbi:Hcp family type VI secretion system effector [Pectobacterium parmentieri]|uniref:Hcp family type VI secretion system effector n=1 Tax=Pectobacterium parmentieri TaxID=1905730 RepID=UPI0018E1269C|nr:Hcp family type VI secretion system effector [Pectobacterium parmentieri]QQA77821.1 Hcp family type VI secretion system effector [Pectobacterium parmentieri]